MAWEIVAIWVIVAATLVLFMRSERQRAADRLADRARHFATAPAYRHRARAAAMPRQPLVLGLSPSDRQFLEFLAQRDERTER